MPDTALRLPTTWLRAYERHGRALPRVAEASFAVLLAYVLALLLWRLIPEPAAAGWTPPIAAPALLGEAPRGINIDLIADAHLFGQFEAPLDPQLDELADAPDTRLDLTLLGILAATEERGSRALINSPGGEEKPYAVGDDVVRGASIQAIFPDRVILSRNGSLETLRLDKDAVGRPPRGPLAQAGGADDGGEAPPSSETSELLADIRQEILSDPSRASEYIRVQPAADGGQLRGYRIYPGRDRTVFTAAGLRPGDLVTQVNGIQLTDASTALQMLGQISQASALTVVIERGGQQQTLNVNFN